jgi:membrane-bound lytic murein transglycosylase B
VIVTAIIGVETMYGRHRGNYRVIDALTTLAFDYPPRSKFFRKELREFLLLAREENQPVTELQGSYAGAMGYGQFIPSSYRHYSVDFNGDGTRDIWNNKVDAIGSVANYLAAHGWRTGEPIVAVARLETAAGNLDSNFNVSLKPSSTLGAMQTLGVITTADLGQSTKVSPMKLVGKLGDEYWLGFHNFYVITRYNHSKLYAMAIFQLSETLRAQDGIVKRQYH